MSDETGLVDEVFDGISPVATGVMKAAAGGVKPAFQETSADIWGALLGDRIKLWRVRNLTNSLEKTASHIANKGIDLSEAKPLPCGDMLALFEGVSKEDDIDLSDLWARLIANAMTERGPASMSSRSVAAVLEQLSPDSARVFMLLANIERFEFLDDMLGKIHHQDFFPLSDAEKSLNEADLKIERDQLHQKVEADWEMILTENSLGEAKLEVAKAELLRLNLVELKQAEIHFDNSPFGRGYQVNANGLDAVLSAMQEKFSELVDNRTRIATSPFLNGNTGVKRSSFELSMAGREIARKLGLL